MKKVSRNRIRVISFTFAAVTVLSIYAYKEHMKAEYYKREAIAFARQAASELAVSAEEVSLALTKCALSPSDELTRTMCAKLYGTCLVTSAAIDALPWQHELENLTSMLENAELIALRGTQSGQVDTDAISSLQEDFEATAQILSAAYNDLNGGFISFGGSVIDPYSNAVEEVDGVIEEINDSASEYAEEILQTKKPTISIDEARAKSARIIGCQLNEIECSIINGALGVTYYCSCEPYTLGVDGDGNIVYYNNAAKIGGEGVNTQDALAAAADFASEMVNAETDVLSYRNEDGYLRCTLSTSGNDLYDIDTPIRVTVDMADGQIAAYDASEYHSAADQRETLYDVYKEAEKNTGIEPPDEADEESKKLCIIKMPWKEQFVCVSYSATAEDGTKYNIYYDATSGIPVDLRIISESEQELRVR